ncbi:YbaK/EbsC family protein [Sphingomonas cannabina]|uniref:aminoacyl-tRNA deacylase n=1 Tax=Sphingomonas cannabina TaxID=2899123 RepID=UPI001F4215AD|nr:YbaK/EbsC family protein [Sphingomonas cannabina]UIJ47219.1 YbaK/EbsC family protein [Sphingomonas cannabina]
MTIAPKLRQFLDLRDVTYDLVEHPPTQSAMQSAAEAHIPPNRMAKAVLLETRDGPLLAVLSADRRIELADLRDDIGEKPQLADEDEVSAIFTGCEPGAVPPMGFGVPLIVDMHLSDEPEVYFEAGDHRSLIRLDHGEFMRLTRRARHASFGTPWSLIE